MIALDVAFGFFGWLCFVWEEVFVVVVVATCESDSLGGRNGLEKTVSCKMAILVSSCCSWSLFLSVLLLLSLPFGCGCLEYVVMFLMDG